MASDSEDPDILQCRESMSTMNTDGRSLSVTFDDRDEMTGSDPSDDDDDGGCESRVSMGNAAQHFPHVDLAHSMKMTEAIQANDYERLIAVLKAIGLTPSTYRGPSGNLLHIIVALGPAQFISKLITDGLDVNEATADGDTPLHIASRLGRATVLEQLLRVDNLDDTILNNAGLTAFHVAKNRQISTAIEYARSLYINKKTKEMQAMVARGDLQALRQLFSIHRNQVVLNVNSTDAHGDTVLHVASKLEHSVDLIRFLLEQGADPFFKNKKGKLPIELTKDEAIRQVLKDAPMITTKAAILSPKARLEGYLNKWTNYAEGYKRRWFVLEDGVLSYYKSQLEYPVSCRGSINLQFAKVLRHGHDKLRFEVISTSNTSTKIHIRAESEAEAQRWIMTLNQASMSSSSSMEIEGTVNSAEPLALALNTTDDFKTIVQRALNELGELERLLNEHLSGENGSTPLTVDNTVKYIFTVREALLAAEEHEHQWRRRWEVERHQKRLLEESFQKLAVENARIENYSRMKAIEEVTGKSPVARMDLERMGSMADEFFDALEAEEAVYASEEPSGAPCQSSTADSGFVVANAVGYPDIRRAVIPSDSTGMPPISLWSILKNAIGKDLSRIPVPVNYSEPLSMLQRLCEEMEYSELLDQAWSQDDPQVRVQLVAAFAASSYASTDGRTTKPFNPLLGETFEYVCKEKGFRYIAEQVSHHPPISACHCESSHYSLWAEVNVASRFWGKSMELTPEGHTHLILKGKGPNGADEHYSWKKVKSSVNNIVVGKLWLDHYGEMNIQCHTTGVKCTLEFKATGWRTVEPKRIVGQAITPDGTVTHEIAGFWNSRLTSTAVATGEEFDLWRRRALPPNAAVMYKFSTFAMTLNELTPDLQAHLAPTDSRLRPDQRAMEEGDFEAANKLKVQLEERQRATRKMLEAQGLCLPPPRWFSKTTDSNTEASYWKFNDQYWECRATSEWTDVPTIF